MFHDEEMALRAAIAQRGPRAPPPPPTAPPPDAAPSTSARLPARPCFSGTASSRSSSNSSLKYDRHSVSPCLDNSLNGQDPFLGVPWHVMYNIFSNLDLRDRVAASMVCSRWNHLLTDGKFPLGDLSVLNIFEHEIWNEKLSNNSQNGLKVDCVNLGDFDEIDGVFRHCLRPWSVKIWFNRLDFLQRILEKLSESDVQLRCLDIYPYQDYVGLGLVHEYLPNLQSIGMRPHAKHYFFRGLPLEHFPNFGHLENLTLDCFQLVGDSVLPSNLTVLDWQCRNEKTLDGFVQRLKPLKELKRLIIGHAHVDAIAFLRLLENVGFWNMANLQYLAFKLSRFEVEHCRNAFSGANSENILKSLKVLRLELCYGDLNLLLNLFLKLTSSELSLLSLTILTKRSDLTMDDIIRLSPYLAARGLRLNLGLMEPNDDPMKRDNVDHDRENYDVSEDDLDVFSTILGVLDVSFVTDSSFMESLTRPVFFKNLTEVKFIQCPAVTDEVLLKFAMGAPQLKRLSLLSCHECTKDGIRQFVESFHQRESDSLTINWQRDREHNGTSCITDFYVDLTREHRSLLDGISFRSYRKQFRSRFGEQIIFWAGEKTMYIQDFDSFDRNRILGIVLPPMAPSDASSESDCSNAREPEPASP